VAFEILDAGLSTRLVDLGRPRSRHLGVPLGGAADRASLALANALVGNSPDAAAIEISLKGPILRATADVTIAMVGAPFVCRAGRREWSGSRSLRLFAGDELYVGGAPSGVRTYLAVPGGFDVPTTLDSHSGLRPLRAGETLPCDSRMTPERIVSPDCPFLQFPRERTLAVMPGAQRDWFPPNALFDSAFTVSTASDRMGLRLDGDKLPSPNREMVSEPVCPGSVQVTREGQPIVLGVDGQTIGGYPKVAQVIRADLDSLGQLRSGDTVRFETVDLDHANRRWRERQQLLREWITRIRISLSGT
jgi:antagonist of KipI